MKRMIRASEDTNKYIIVTPSGDKADLTDGYEYKDGALYRNAAAGQFLDSKRPTRVVGKWKIYVNSFPDAAYPYSVARIADSETGEVYRFEFPQGYGILKDIVEHLKSM